METKVSKMIQNGNQGFQNEVKGKPRFPKSHSASRWDSFPASLLAHFYFWVAYSYNLTLALAIFTCTFNLVSFILNILNPTHSLLWLNNLSMNLGAEVHRLNNEYKSWIFEQTTRKQKMSKKLDGTFTAACAVGFESLKLFRKWF